MQGAASSCGGSGNQSARLGLNTCKQMLSCPVLSCPQHCVQACLMHMPSGLHGLVQTQADQGVARLPWTLMSSQHVDCRACLPCLTARASWHLSWLTSGLAQPPRVRSDQCAIVSHLHAHRSRRRASAYVHVYIPACGSARPPAQGCQPVCQAFPPLLRTAPAQCQPCHAAELRWACLSCWHSMPPV